MDVKKALAYIVNHAPEDEKEVFQLISDELTEHLNGLAGEFENCIAIKKILNEILNISPYKYHDEGVTVYIDFDLIEKGRKLINGGK